MNIIGDMAMDLRRAALGSEKMSQIFLREAAKKIDKVNGNIPGYIKKILAGFGKDRERLLMQSILLQNYATKH